MALKVYERYLAREIYESSLLVLASFLGLFAFFDLIYEMESLGKGTYQLQDAVFYVLLTLPGRAYEILPIAVLIGSLYALTLLARHSEITVLRASGLPTASLLMSLGKIGTLFVALTFIVGEFIAPPAERAAQQLRLSAMSKLIAQEFRSGLWVKDGLSFINVRDVLPDASLRGVRVYDFDADHHLRSISQASTGHYTAASGWQLGKVTQTHFDAAGARIEEHETLQWQSALNPDILSVLLVVPERMSLVSLYQYIRHLSENNQKTQRYEIAWWKKILYPFAALVMMALALPFALSHDRMSAVSVKVFTGVMLGIFFHMLNGLFSHLGMINSWRPLISAITPSVIFLLAAASMLWWVERR
ncbi:MAG: LPS export ABC transporter permease LptG [Rhodocyclaceae bacterium]|nr:LPS export ABC transporter permease LptG [Rhodocyclaceae bacterium]MDZ4214729.1 LPS export ABC transporter permease LptG [Rhodocyclaceae bacterium]